MYIPIFVVTCSILIVLESALINCSTTCVSPVFVSFLKPITPEQYQNLTTEQVSQLIHDNIQREISFNLRLKDHQLMIKNKKYKFNKII